MRYFLYIPILLFLSVCACISIKNGYNYLYGFVEVCECRTNTLQYVINVTLVREEKETISDKTLNKRDVMYLPSIYIDGDSVSQTNITLGNVSCDVKKNDQLHVCVTVRDDKTKNVYEGKTILNSGERKQIVLLPDM